jgi:hypothetical protein
MISRRYWKGLGGKAMITRIWTWYTIFLYENLGVHRNYIFQDKLMDHGVTAG